MIGVDRWKNGEVVAKKEQFLIQIWQKWRYTVFGMLILKRGEKGKFEDLEKGRGLFGIR